jgi:hypothetical protein
MNRLFVPLVLASTIPLAAISLAGELPDPTRPPAALRPTTPTAGPYVPAAPALVLQSVLIGAGRKPTAIINGHVVEVGESLDGMRLVRVFDGGAVLAGRNGPTTLALTPEIEKVAAAPQPESSALVAMTRPTRRPDAAPPMVRTGDRK